MSTEDLNLLAERLRSEIDALDSTHGEARERLDALHAELVQRLEHPREDNQDEDLLENIKTHIEAFEVAHPRATGILNDLMVTLSNMGI